MSKEVWKNILGDYYISNRGRVYSSKSNKILKYKDNGKGYLSVPFQINGKSKRYYVHRLVAQAFISNPENKPCVNHKDGVKSNNNVDNLEWCTRKENIQHAVKNGLIPTALNEEQKEKIKKLYSETKLSTTEIGNMYNVSANCVQNCVKNVLPKFNRSGRNKYRKKITKTEKEEIREKYLTGKYSLQSLSEEYKIGSSSVYRIVKDLPTRSLASLTDEEQIKAFELYQTGSYSQREIGEIFNTPTQNINYYFRKIRKNLNC